MNSARNYSRVILIAMTVWLAMPSNASAVCTYQQYFEALKSAVGPDWRHVSVIGFALHGDSLYLNLKDDDDAEFGRFMRHLDEVDGFSEVKLGGYTEGAPPNYEEISIKLADDFCESRNP